jgi:hypothetical protein
MRWSSIGGTLPPIYYYEPSQTYVWLSVHNRGKTLLKRSFFDSPPKPRCTVTQRRIPPNNPKEEYHRIIPEKNTTEQSKGE